MYSSQPEIWRPFTQMKNAFPALSVKSAKDANLYLDDGRKIIDAISSWWVITHGHCHDRIAKAICDQSHQLDQTLFANFSHKPAIELTNILSKFLPKNLSKYFFTDNGSTAVEAALKMVLQHWINRGEEQKKLFVTFEKSYHGDTVGAMSVGGNTAFTKPYKEMLFSVLKVKQGLISTDKLESYVQPFLECLKKNKEHIAGIIIEPLLQGAGGMILWPIEALEIIGKEAKKNDIPIIFDEVMTGFGRTGKMFSFEHLSFTPNIICLSKGLTGGALPLALTIADDDIYNSFLSKQKEKMFFHGHSFTGNPISCSAAVASLKIFLDQDSPALWNNIEKIHKTRSKKLSSELINDQRGIGTVFALQLNSHEKGYTSNKLNQLTQFSLNNGVFLRPLGNVLYILPPYSITNKELNHVWDVIEEFVRQSE